MHSNNVRLYHRVHVTAVRYPTLYMRTFTCDLREIYALVLWKQQETYDTCLQEL